MKTQYQKHINHIGAVLLLSAAALIACGENATNSKYKGTGAGQSEKQRL